VGIGSIVSTRPAIPVALLVPALLFGRIPTATAGSGGAQ